MREVGIALILILLVLGVIWAYLFAWHGRSSIVRRAASGIVATLVTLVALVGTFAYAVPGLGDFHNPNVSFRAALIGNVIMWAICLGLWVIAARFALLALRKP